MTGPDGQVKGYLLTDLPEDEEEEEDDICYTEVDKIYRKDTAIVIEIDDAVLQMTEENVSDILPVDNAGNEFYVAQIYFKDKKRFASHKRFVSHAGAELCVSGS